MGGAVDAAVHRRGASAPFEPQRAALERLEAAADRDAVPRAIREREDLRGGRVAVLLVDELGQGAAAHRLGGMARTALPGGGAPPPGAGPDRPPPEHRPPPQI